MTNDLTFGQFISEQRQKHSMESQELAKALGISGAYLSQLERGVRTNPSTELLDKIAMVLCLNKIETETLYDLYAKVSRQISLILPYMFPPVKQCGKHCGLPVMPMQQRKIGNNS